MECTRRRSSCAQEVDVPQAADGATAAAVVDDADVADRLYREAGLRQLRLRHLQLHHTALRRQEEQREATFSPAIDESQRRCRGIGKAMQDPEGLAAKQRLEQLKEKQEKAMLQDCTFQPQVDQKSEAIMLKKLSRMQLSGPLYEALYEDALRRRERQQGYTNRPAPLRHRSHHQGEAPPLQPREHPQTRPSLQPHPVEQPPQEPRWQQQQQLEPPLVAPLQAQEPPVVQPLCQPNPQPLPQPLRGRSEPQLQVLSRLQDPQPQADPPRQAHPFQQPPQQPTQSGGCNSSQERLPCSKPAVGTPRAAIAAVATSATALGLAVPTPTPRRPASAGAGGRQGGRPGGTSGASGSDAANKRQLHGAGFSKASDTTSSSRTGCTTRLGSSFQAAVAG